MGPAHKDASPQKARFLGVVKVTGKQAGKHLVGRIPADNHNRIQDLKLAHRESCEERELQVWLDWWVLL